MQNTEQAAALGLSRLEKENARLRLLIDINRIADWTVRLLLDSAPAQRPRQVIVPGSVVQRGSTAAPANGNGSLTQPGEAVL